MKRILGVLLVFLGVTTGQAQQAPGSSLLWEINGNGLQSPSYLFGTFHIMCKPDFSFSDTLKNTIRSTKQFYAELVMDDPNMQMELAMKMLMKDNTLSGLMGDAEFKKASDNFQKITGMPLAMFNTFKPFMALSAVTAYSIPCNNKVQPETEFTAFAKENKLPVLGLETLDDQVRVMNAEPLDSQVASLKKILINFDSVKTIMKQMIEVYRMRDIDTLYSFMKAAGENSEFEKELLLKRNHAWVPLIEKAAKEKSSFFAVGAGHLGGNEGVINLLRTRGYTLTPVRY